jgi:predicted DNA-binding transcriptional regulator YafY
MLLKFKKKKHPSPKLAEPSPDRSARPPLERMSRLHDLIQSQTYPNCTLLAEELEVSRKTIQRDLDFMRDRLGLPIAYDGAKFGFYYTEPVESVPEMEVSEGELVALLIAQKSLQQHRGTVYEGPLRSACTKIAAALRERVSVDIADLASQISFKEQGFNEVSVELFDVVGRAVRLSRALKFLYKKLGAAAEEPRRIHPYHLGCINNQWYVFGWDLDRQGLRTFALTRLREPKLQRNRFQRPADFSIETFLADSMGVFRGGKELEKVHIRFDGWVAQIVRERVWHSSEKKTELPNGGLDLELLLSSLEEVERWVLGFGPNAKVLHPPALVERMRRTTRQMAALYRASEA